jgi:hypothetical protein
MVSILVESTDWRSPLELDIFTCQMLARSLFPRLKSSLGSRGGVKVKCPRKRRVFQAEIRLGNRLHLAIPFAIVVANCQRSTASVIL